MLPRAQDGDGNTLGGEGRGASQKNRDQAEVWSGARGRPAVSGLWAQKGEFIQRAESRQATQVARVLWSLGPKALISGSSWQSVIPAGGTEGPQVLHLQARCSGFVPLLLGESQSFSGV